MTWHRVESRPQAPPAKYLDALRSELGGRDDDEQVQMTVGQVRELLDALAPPEIAPGAQVYDDERGVTYRATLQGEAGDRSLRTVEVVPDEGTVDPGIYRVPVSLLTVMTAEVVAATESGRVTLDNRSDVARGHRPSAQELAQLLRRGYTRNRIAEEYDRKVSTVDQWLRRARRERPDEFPEATRGPKSTSK